MRKALKNSQNKLLNNARNYTHALASLTMPDDLARQNSQDNVDYEGNVGGDADAVPSGETFLINQPSELGHLGEKSASIFLFDP